MARAHAKPNHSSKSAPQQPAIPPSPAMTQASAQKASAPKAPEAKASETKMPETKVAAEQKPESRPSPSAEQIALRAYELFLERGGEHGRHDDDWHQAERELRLSR